MRVFFAACLLAIPAYANAGGNSITLYVGGCHEADLSADVLHAADQNSGELKRMAVTVVVDEHQKRCGYDLRKGRKVRHLKSGLTDIELHEELVKFFGDAATKRQSAVHGAS